MKWRTKIAYWLLRRYDFFLVVTDIASGAVMTNWEDDEAVKGVLESGVRNRDNIRSLILEVAKRYLKRYTIDRDNFAKEIYEED